MRTTPRIFPAKSLFCLIVIFFKVVNLYCNIICWTCWWDPLAPQTSWYEYHIAQTAACHTAGWCLRKNKKSCMSTIKIIWIQIHDYTNSDLAPNWTLTLAKQKLVRYFLFKNLKNPKKNLKPLKELNTKISPTGGLLLHYLRLSSTF